MPDSPDPRTAWKCDWKPDDLNPGPECPYCAGDMCGRFDGLNCRHDRIERHGYPTSPDPREREEPRLIVEWNRDKPHRCPECHAVVVRRSEGETLRSWRVYTCGECGTRFTRWPILFVLKRAR